MQTFLPYEDFYRTADCLDIKRLGKQRVEAMQILQVIYRKVVLKEANGAWFNHPAVLMWEDYPWALGRYLDCMVRRWLSYGYKDTCAQKFVGVYWGIPHALCRQGEVPHWLGREDFHASHRSNLLRKNPQHYSQFNWEADITLPYVWPVRKIGTK